MILWSLPGLLNTICSFGFSPAWPFKILIWYQRNKTYYIPEGCVHWGGKWNLFPWKLAQNRHVLSVREEMKGMSLLQQEQCLCSWNFLPSIKPISERDWEESFWWDWRMVGRVPPRGQRRGIQMIGLNRGESWCSLKNEVQGLGTVRRRDQDSRQFDPWGVKACYSTSGLFHHNVNESLYIWV